MVAIYKNIAVNIDGSGISDKAFQRALDIASSNKAKLILLHFIQSRTLAAKSYEKTLIAQVDDNGGSWLRHYHNLAEQAGIHDIVQKLEYGTIKQKMMDHLHQQFQIDLFVCGAEKHSAVKYFLIGNKAEDISRYASCDVLIVK